MEHYVPKSQIPRSLANMSANKFPAIKVFNNIKGSLFPCEWEQQKYDLCYRAVIHYNLRTADKNLIKQALEGMPYINPCERCICTIFREYCAKEH